MSNSAIVPETTRSRPIRDSFADLLAGIRDGLDMQARYDALSRLTPLELARLGLSRGDISRVVATGVRLQCSTHQGSRSPRSNCDPPHTRHSVSSPTAEPSHRL